MVHSFTQKQIDFFYQWARPYQGCEVHEKCVPIAPHFRPFFYPHFGASSTVPADDGRAPTFFDSVGDFSKKLLNRFSSKPQPENVLLLPEHAAPQPSLTTFRAFLPPEERNKIHVLHQLLIMLAQCQKPIAFEIVTSSTIQLQFTCAERDKEHLSSQMKGHFPQIIFQEQNDLLGKIAAVENYVSIVDLGLREEFLRPLITLPAIEVDPFVGLFSTLEKIAEDEMAVIQLLFQVSNHPWQDSVMRATINEIGQPFFYHSPEMVSCAKQKISSRLYGGVLRVLAQSNSIQRADAIASHISQTLVQLSHSNTNSLTVLSNENYPDEIHLSDVIDRTSHRSPMVLNSHELLIFLHFPSREVNSKKFICNIKKTKAPPAICQSGSLVLGMNEHRSELQEVCIENSIRFRHLLLTGASGMGKSTLLLQMALQDAVSGAGLCIIDPHGDLILDFLHHVPLHRMNDVIILNPADAEHPIALNILKAHSSIEKEILCSDLISAFRKNSLSWGDSLHSIFASAISAMLNSTMGGTLVDLRKFLLDKQFRNTFLKTVTDPNLVYYWQQEYPLLKSTSTASILTRLDSFLRPSIIRNMVAQKTSLDFEDILNNKKILLVQLNHGTIGAENSFLLGTLIVTKIYQAAIARQELNTRQPFFLFVDEFHNYTTASGSINDILTGGRKYNLSLTLAHQQLSQVPSDIADAIMANVATRIYFRLGENDSKKIAEGFSSFTAQDFQNLGRGEAIVRVDRPDYDFTLQTIPSGKVKNSAADIEMMIEQSREKYCVPRETVERLLLESIGKNAASAEKEIKPKDILSVLRQPAIETVNTNKQDANSELTVINSKENNVKQPKHREMQMLVKEMGERFGFVATIEHQLPNTTGQVDVLFTKEQKTIAVEISVRTGKKWEVHNIEKCIASKYDIVISLTQNERQAQQIKNEFEKIKLQTSALIYFFTLETFYAFLQKEKNQEVGKKKLRGYQINVSYEKPIDK